MVVSVIFLICLIHIDINQHNSMQLGDLIIGSYNTSNQK